MKTIGRLRSVILMAVGVGGCCGDTVRSVDLWWAYPGEDGVDLALGDTATFQAQASDEARGFSPQCDLYYSFETPGRFAFSSTNPEVAVIDEVGLLTALAEGQTTVRAAVEGVVSNDVVVTVSADAPGTSPAVSSRSPVAGTLPGLTVASSLAPRKLAAARGRVPCVTGLRQLEASNRTVTVP